MYEDLEEKSVLASCLLLLPDQHPKKPKAQVEMKPIGCGRRIDNPEKNTSLKKMRQTIMQINLFQIFFLRTSNVENRYEKQQRLRRDGGQSASEQGFSQVYAKFQKENYSLI